MSRTEPPPGPPSRGPVYGRSGSGLQFDRVAFFSDAVFAIAMTLLVVGIGIPSSVDEVFDEKLPEIIAFFIGFAVLANYWIAHHRLFALLQRVDVRFIRLNLVYLCAVAFLPFPIGAFGEFDYDLKIFLMFAGTLAVISFMETVMFAHSHVRKLFGAHFSARTFRFAMVASLIPVLVFAISVPIAVWSTTWALVAWLLIVPLEAIADRVAPEAAAELSG